LRAYNRWLGERSSPGRQLGVGLIAFHDPTYALTQVRNARKIGLRGVMPQWDGLDSGFLPLYDEAFDPVWSACVEENLPVSFHPLAGRPRDTYFGVDETIPFSAGPFVSRKNTQSTMIFEAESLFWSRRCLWHMILGGVLERHPQLRVGFVEMWTDWIPRTLEWLDYLLERKARGRLTKWESVCPLPASEYWRRQCFVGAHAWSLDDIELRHELGVDTFTFGTDFPHANSPVNQVTPFLRATLGASNVSESDARAILGENMVRIYDLDIAMLEPIADRVGPLPEEILRIPSNQDPNEGLSPYLQMTIHHPAIGAG
jgi:predicted TIM-barrel fold metal-dependent hydrolase